jgi:hypothetical protein
MFRTDDRIKYALNDKLTIDGETKSVITWINLKPITLNKFLNTNPSVTLNPHGNLTLKKKLNEKDTGSNTKRSPRSSS